MDSHEVRRGWAERSGEYSPAYYAYYGPDDTSEAVRRLIDRYVGPDGRVLELGCGAGRHLAHLLDHGYDRLTGVEVNADAPAVLRESYPALAERGRFRFDAIEAVVEEFETDGFDAVFSVETLQHLHPDAEWVFDEIARVTGDLLVTVENEGTGADRAGPGPGVSYVNGEFPLYYRDWNAVFTARGLVSVAARPGERDTLRAFRTRTRAGTRA